MCAKIFMSHGIGVRLREEIEAVAFHIECLFIPRRKFVRDDNESLSSPLFFSIDGHDNDDDENSTISTLLHQ